jgi:putative transposase
VKELTALSEAQRHRALERYRLLQPHLEEGQALTKVAAQASLSYRTVQRWVSLYRRFGLAALCRQDRSDRAVRRRLSPVLQQAIEGFALQKPALSVAAIHRQICQLAQQRREPFPSYDVVYDIVRQLPTDLVTLAQKGPQTYANTYEMVHRREAKCPNAIWQADHTLLDVLVRREDGALAKPWLTVILDDYSRAVAGYVLSFDAPSAIQTALALRQAIWRKEDARWSVCGIPEVFYSDNGRDFRSQHMEQVAADLKIQLIFSTPGQPRGRGRIERFFQTLTSLWLTELPGYSPSGVSSHSRSHDAEAHLTLSELDLQLCEFLLAVYHQRRHSTTKKRPKERWEHGNEHGDESSAGTGFLPRMPDSLEQLDLLLLTVAQTRRVHPDGIRFQGLRYVDATLAAYIGESVLLRYDPRDLAEVRVFHEGHFVCRAVCPELAGEVISLRDVVRARNERRRELRTRLRERQKTVDSLLELKQSRPIGVHSAEFIAETPQEPSGAESSKARTVRSTTPLRRYLNE